MTEIKTGHLMSLSDTGQNLTDKVSDTVSEDLLDWEPTRKEAALLEAAGKIGLNRGVSAICEEAETSRETYYKAQKKPGFRAAWADKARQVMESGSPGVSAAVTQKAIGGDMTAARLHLQATGMVGSGGLNLHVGDQINKQLHVHGQQPGQQAYNDHRGLVYRANNEEEFKITVEIGERVAAEMLEREERGEPPLTDAQQLQAIKIGTEKVIAERAAKEAEEVVAGQSEVIDVTSVEVAEAD